MMTSLKLDNVDSCAASNKLVRSWWIALWLTNAAFLAATFGKNVGLPGAPLLILLDLGREMCVGAWWSAMQLLAFGMLALAARAHVPTADPWLRKALLVLSLIGFALCADEIGSIHERVGQIYPYHSNLNLLPFALAGGFGVAFATGILFIRRAVFGPVWLWITAGFAMFALVWIQEKVEHSFEWTGAIAALRVTIEEGTELTGFFLLLAGIMTLRRYQEGGTFTILDALPRRHEVRQVGAALLVCSIPVIAFRLQFNAEQLVLGRRGDFAMAVPIMVFALAAIHALRSGLVDRAHRVRWWFLAAVLLILSIDAEIYSNRYLDRFFPWLHTANPMRMEPNLLWSIPLLGLAISRLSLFPGIALFGVMATLWSLTALSLWVSHTWLTMALPHLTAAGAFCLVICSPRGEDRTSGAGLTKRLPRDEPAHTSWPN